jgi:MFS family permease
LIRAVTTPGIYTKQFWLVCLSSLLFFASFNMIIPELPGYLSALGGSEYKGLIISLFAITAMLSRPFSGKLADTIGRVPVMLAGSVVCFICSLIYPVLTSITGFLLLRLVHGFSTGFTPTGQTAFISDIIPAERRGEAMGLLGTAGSLGMAGGPAIGGTLANNLGLDAMFYCSSAFGLISVMIILSMRETLHEKHTFVVRHLKMKRQDLFEPGVLTPCLIMVLCSYSYGALFTVIPDFGNYLGVRNKGLLFSCLTVASLMVRLLGGKASDHYGRKAVLRVSTVVMVIAMFIIATADTSLQLMLGIGLYGLAQGVTSPTLLAWATDLSPLHRTGRGVSSLYIFMECGIGIGAFASGLIYGNKPVHFFHTYLVCALLAGVAFIYLMIHRTRSHPAEPLSEPS